jgi:hypothetical protein
VLIGCFLVQLQLFWNDIAGGALPLLPSFEMCCVRCTQTDPMTAHSPPFAFELHYHKQSAKPSNLSVFQHARSCLFDRQSTNGNSSHFNFSLRSWFPHSTFTIFLHFDHHSSAATVTDPFTSYTPSSTLRRNILHIFKIPNCTLEHYSCNQDLTSLRRCLGFRGQYAWRALAPVLYNYLVGGV